MILAIVQARMSSNRLPGKVLKEIVGKPMIGLLLERLASVQCFDKIVLATSDQKADSLLCDYVKSLGIEVFRGSENDVLDRYYQCARYFSANHIARITGDCPMIDPAIISVATEAYLKSGADYLANDYPTPTFPDGMDYEIFSFKALEKTWRNAELVSDREHVTSYIRNQSHFKCVGFNSKVDLSSHRLTVDEQLDLEKARVIFENLYPVNNLFALPEILAFLERHPEIMNLNQNIERNEGYKISVREDNETR